MATLRAMDADAMKKMKRVNPMPPPPAAAGALFFTEPF